MPNRPHSSRKWSSVTGVRPAMGEILSGNLDDSRLAGAHLGRTLGRGLHKDGVELFIHSNGGSGTVPWRVVDLVRQYAKSFAVLVPQEHDRRNPLRPRV